MTAHQRKDRFTMRQQALNHRFWTSPKRHGLTWDARMERATRTLALAIHFRDLSQPGVARNGADFGDLYPNLRWNGERWTSQNGRKH